MCVCVRGRVSRLVSCYFFSPNAGRVTRYIYTHCATVHPLSRSAFPHISYVSMHPEIVFLLVCQQRHPNECVCRVTSLCLCVCVSERVSVCLCVGKESVFQLCRASSLITFSSPSATSSLTAIICPSAVCCPPLHWVSCLPSHNSRHKCESNQKDCHFIRKLFCDLLLFKQAESGRQQQQQYPVERSLDSSSW